MSRSWAKVPSLYNMRYKDKPAMWSTYNFPTNNNVKPMLCGYGKTGNMLSGAELKDPQEQTSRAEINICISEPNIRFTGLNQTQFSL